MYGDGDILPGIGGRGQRYVIFGEFPVIGQHLVDSGGAEATGN